MTVVMVSYRQPVDTPWAGRLVDQLRRVLVTEHLEIVDSSQLDTLPPPFDLGLVVIGPDWKRTIGAPVDVVRDEVQSMLARGTRVVPVLVGGATMPTREDLPPGLRALTDLSPVILSDQHFREDVDQLSLTLVAVGQLVRRRDHEREGNRRVLGAAVGFVALSVWGLAFPGFGLAALVWSLASRRALRRRGPTGMALANLALGLGVFSPVFNAFFLYDQFT